MRVLLVVALLFSFSSQSVAQAIHHKAEKESTRETNPLVETYRSAGSRYWQGRSVLGGGKVNSLNRKETRHMISTTKLSDGYYSLSATFFKDRFLQMDGEQRKKTSLRPGKVVQIPQELGWQTQRKRKKGRGKARRIPNR